LDKIITFLKEYFNINILVLFFVSSFFLLYFDSREFKKKSMQRDYKFSLYIGIAYIIGGLGIYLLTKFI
jgi:hypothetical protein